VRTLSLALFFFSGSLMAQGAVDDATAVDESPATTVPETATPDDVEVPAEIDEEPEAANDDVDAGAPLASPDGTTAVTPIADAPDAPAEIEAKAPAKTTTTTGKAATDKKSSAENKEDAAMAALLGPGAAGQKAYVFRGSTLTLQSAFTATSLWPAAEQTYNPMFQVGIGVNPVVWFGKIFNITGYLEVNRELTNADLTTYDGELQLSDLFLSGRATNFWTIPFVGIGLSAAGTVILPTSKWSFAQTMLGGVEANMTAVRAFNLLSGLVFGYQIRGGKNFHAFTTGENETSLEDGRCLNVQYCGVWASNGVRNVDWTMQNRAFMQWSLVDWAGFFVDGRLIHQWLYPIANKDPRVTFSPEDPLGKYGEQSMRHFTGVFTGVFITPHPATTISFGTSTFAPQLGPNSKYYIPGFNRWTQIYANLQFNMGGIASLLDDS
jgi:hypothetical protein